MNARQAAALAKIDAAIDASDLVGKDGSKRISEDDAAKVAGGRKTLEALLRRQALRVTYSDAEFGLRFYVEKGAGR